MTLDQAGWRCRIRGHHRWRFPAEAYESRETVSIQTCSRAGCLAVKETVTPDTPQEPKLPLMKVSELLRLRAWDWGAPLDVDYPPLREVADGSSD